MAQISLHHGDCPEILPTPGGVEPGTEEELVETIRRSPNCFDAPPMGDES